MTVVVAPGSSAGASELPDDSRQPQDLTQIWLQEFWSGVVMNRYTLTGSQLEHHCPQSCYARKSSLNTCKYDDSDQTMPHSIIS
jgi:hypothetical protein